MKTINLSNMITIILILSAIIGALFYDLKKSKNKIKNLNKRLEERDSIINTIVVQAKLKKEIIVPDNYEKITDKHYKDSLVLVNSIGTLFYSNVFEDTTLCLLSDANHTTITHSTFKNTNMNPDFEALNFDEL